MKRHHLILVIILAVGLAIRIFLAPYSAGSDIVQFAGFAETFHRHGLCFYSYASSWSTERWPYNWPYIYGPIWMYVLGALRGVTKPCVKAFWINGTYKVYISTNWIIAVKTVLIIFDTLATILLYMIISSMGGIPWGLLSAALYYLNPMTIYISGIYGMFDQIPLTIFLASMIVYRRGMNSLSGLLLGISIMVKQTFLFASAPIIALSIVRRNKAFITGFVAGLLIPIMPVLLVCPSSIMGFLDTLYILEPGYTIPIMYSFNGISSFATLIHQYCPGCDTLWVIKGWYVPALIMYSLIAIYIIGGGSLITSTSLSYIIFTTTYWRVNHQYLVPTIAFLLIVAATARDFKIRLLSLLLTFYIGFWVIMFPTSWWFHVHVENPNRDLIKLVDSMTLMIFCDVAYALYSLGLTILQYMLIIYSISEYISPILRKSIKLYLHGV